MSTPQHRGKIKNVRKSNGGFAYDRVAPGVTFPSDRLDDEEIKKLSSEVKVYQKEEEK